MSPRAAWRLESLGFESVCDYVAGRADWFAAGLPAEGALADALSAGDVVDAAPLTAALSDSTNSVTERLRSQGRDFAVVTNAERVVLGRVRLEALAASPGEAVAVVLENGPTTIRPDTPLKDIVSRLQRRNVPQVLVTTSEGRLVGVLDRATAETALADGEEACLCD